MSDGVIALIAVGAVIAYSAIAGVSFALCADEEAKVPAAVFWPIAFPAMLGSALVRWLRTPRASKLPGARVVGQRPR